MAQQIVIIRTNALQSKTMGNKPKKTKLKTGENT